MKKIIYILALFVSVISFNSCLVDDNDPTDEFGTGSNYIGFNSSERDINILTDGNTKSVIEPVLIQGPTYKELTDEITCKVSVDPSSTAVLGTHFTLGSTTLTLKPGLDFISALNLTVLSENIESPDSKTLILTLTDISSDKVITSGRTGKITININYLCVSDLAGDYSLVTTNLSSGAVKNHGIVTISQTGDGEYHTMSTGTWTIGSLRPDQGYNFVDFCGNITVPDQYLFDYYSNQVYQTEADLANSYVDEATGNITVQYWIWFAAGDKNYKDVYTKL